MRVGLHCGPVHGIVANAGALKYALIGDTARVAARMENEGAPSMVHCSAAIARLIGLQAYDMALRPRPADPLPRRSIIIRPILFTRSATAPYRLLR